MVVPISTTHDYDHDHRVVAAPPGGAIKEKEKKGASDRHSKIAVKNRLRHRRLRLSIDVARELFDLQDMLNFERASKAVEWLLVLAGPDIARLRRELNPAAECDAVNYSGLDDEHATKNKKKKKHRKPSKPRSPVAKEAREMARKRARERTFNKKRSLTTSLPTNNSWQSMESAGFHEKLPQQHVVNNLVLPDDLFDDIIGMSFGMTTI